MRVLVLLVLVNFYTVVIRNLLELFHTLFEFLQVLTLLILDPLALLDLLLELVDLVLQEGEALSRVVDLGRVLMCHTPGAHSYFTLLADKSIHTFFSFNLLMMKLLKHLLVVLNFFLRLLDVALQIQKKLRRLHLFQTFLYSLMLLDQVLYRLVCILDLLLPRSYLLRPGPVRVNMSLTANFLLLQTLLVHLVDEEVYVFAHLLQLISQLLVLRLQILLLPRIVSQGLYQFGSITHLI
jgi:hypothetical protein